MTDARALPLTGKFSATHGAALTTAGGAFGIATALVAFYVGTAELLNDPVNSWFMLPLGPIPKGRID